MQTMSHGCHRRQQEFPNGPREEQRVFKPEGHHSHRITLSRLCFVLRVNMESEYGRLDDSFLSSERTVQGIGLHVTQPFVAQSTHQVSIYFMHKMFSSSKRPYVSSH